MTSYVLVGDSESKNNFVTNFISQKNIPSYNLFDYEETLKIPQVREIKKLLSTKGMSGAKRLFIIRDATIAAQNALLKTLEELPEDTSFIFLEYSDLIPTILSRARILNFKREKIDKDTNLLNMLEKFIDGPAFRGAGKKDMFSTLLFSDELFAQNPDLNFSDLVLCLREILFEKLKEGDGKKAILVLKLIKSCYKYIVFIENNNLNKRLLLERLLIAEL